MLEREGIGGHLVFADDEDISRPHLVSGLERLFYTKRLVSEIDHQIVTAQFASQAGGFTIHARAERSNINVGLAEHRLRRRGLGQRKHQPVFSDGKANARSGRSAEGFRQPVVSAAAENRVLRPQRPMRKFKSGFLVVIQASHQARVFLVGNLDGVQDLFYCFVVGAASFVQKLGDGGESFDDGLVFGNFAVENSQRIGYGAALAVGAHFSYYGRERLAESFVEFCTVGGAAYGIELECPLGDTDAVEQRGQELKNLRVAHGRLAAGGGGPDDLGVNLVELAVASFLRALAAKHRADGEEFVEAALPEFVLDVGADDAGGVFGTEGERLSSIAFGAAAIFPGEHFLRDDVGLFAYAAGEEFGGLEDGGADFVEVVGAEDVAHGGFDEVPERGVGREKVAGSSGRFDHFVFDRWSLVKLSAKLRRGKPRLYGWVLLSLLHWISLTSNRYFCGYRRECSRSTHQAKSACVAYSLSSSMNNRGSRRLFEMELRMRFSLGSIS